MHQRDGEICQGREGGALKYLWGGRNRFLLFLFVGDPNEEKVSGKPWKEGGRAEERGRRLRRAKKGRKIKSGQRRGAGGSGGGLAKALSPTGNFFHSLAFRHAKDPLDSAGEKERASKIASERMGVHPSSAAAVQV